MKHGATMMGHMWHIIKNDGKALCNSNLNIRAVTDNLISSVVCNSCETRAQLSKNKRLLYPENEGGDGI